jgi:hypothetical protein
MGMTSHQLPTSRSLFRALGATLAVGSLTLLAACGDDESSSDTTAAAAATTVAGEAAAPVITGAWARTSPSMATAGAAYVTITSPVDDKLLSASVDPSVAGMVQIHETVMATDTTMAGSDTTMMGGTETTMGGGAMTMQPVESIELPAGVAVEMKPGGYHIMMMDLVKPLEIGSTLKVTLTFETAGEITIDVPVLDEAP